MPCGSGEVEGRESRARAAGGGEERGGEGRRGEERRRKGKRRLSEERNGRRERNAWQPGEGREPRRGGANGSHLNRLNGTSKAQNPNSTPWKPNPGKLPLVAVPALLLTGGSKVVSLHRSQVTGVRGVNVSPCRLAAQSAGKKYR